MSVINVSEAPVDESTDNVSTESTTESTDVGGAEAEVPEGTSDSTEPEAELILGKFKDQDALIDSYKELTAKLREKQPEAPEEYKFDFSEHEVLGQHKDLVAEVLETSPLIKAATAKFKEHNIPQSVADDILSTVLTEDIASLGDPEQVTKDLGDGAEQIINEVNQYVSRFPKEEQAVFAQLGMSAEGVKLVHKLSKMGQSKPIPAKADTTPAKSSADYWAEAREVKKQMNGNLQFDTAKTAEYERLTDLAIQAEEREKNR